MRVIIVGQRNFAWATLVYTIRLLQSIDMANRETTPLYRCWLGRRKA